MHLEKVMASFQNITNQQGMGALRNTSLDVVTSGTSKTPRQKVSSNSKQNKILKSALQEAQEEIKRLKEEKKEKDMIFTEILQNKQSKQLKQNTEKYAFTNAYGYNPPLPTAIEDLKRLKQLEEELEKVKKELKETSTQLTKSNDLVNKYSKQLSSNNTGTTGIPSGSNNGGSFISSSVPPLNLGGSGGGLGGSGGGLGMKSVVGNTGITKERSNTLPNKVPPPSLFTPINFLKK